MSYHHKRKSCSKKTREILEEILEIDKAEYTMAELDSFVSETKSLEKTLNDDATNLLHRDRAISKELEELESYETTEKLEFEAAAVKESFEKKKKKRNYIEFRPDYVST